MAINKLTIIGNIGSEPKVFAFENSDRLAISFSVAVTDTWKDAEGNKKENTTWVRCVRYTKSDAVVKYLNKGDKIYLEGKAMATAYLKEGEPIGQLELVIDKIDFISSKKDFSNNPELPTNLPPNLSGENQQDDDLPF